ncbi:glycosyltransferase family 4 protein [Oculatella sp. LEGE 06141]|uniref:glycosyltransferase family 4 protein n=1 Tax=Oculatella sp. LEGE 06141 TaxID=1828648 RepID=UPI00187E3EE3|nr:glycosyltransferase family 4 protein [Oculatella sp. LEGE 06141]MBE9179729.1 glycosyltransferase family 4 protein [Oculatella sp. LEGE 06141]
MKLAYVTVYDASDIRKWSGSAHYITKALEQQAIEVVYVGSLREYQAYFFKAKQLFYQRVLGKNYHRDREPSILKHYAKQVAHQLNSLNVDVVFSTGTVPICYLECDRPVVVWTDCTYAGMVDFYPRWSNLCRESLINGNQMEQRALSNCQLALFTSQWAAQTAKDHYAIADSNIKVVPFGANIECDRTLEDVRGLVQRRSKQTCKLLFLGVDWYRKGGDLAVQVAQALNDQGLPTELTIVGCTPPADVPDFVTVKGFISKATQDGRDAIDQLLAESHFLLFPSRAECYGVVVAEANSFGVPVVASNVGGIPTAVQTGKNGIAVPLDTFVAEACRFILEAMNHFTHYEELADSAFIEYESRLNWQVAGKTVREYLEGLV